MSEGTGAEGGGWLTWSEVWRLSRAMAGQAVLCYVLAVVLVLALSPVWLMMFWPFW